MKVFRSNLKNFEYRRFRLIWWVSSNSYFYILNITHISTLFHLHIFQKIPNNNSQTTLPNTLYKLISFQRRKFNYWKNTEPFAFTFTFTFERHKGIIVLPFSTGHRNHLWFNVEQLLACYGYVVVLSMAHRIVMYHKSYSLNPARFFLFLPFIFFFNLLLSWMIKPYIPLNSIISLDICTGNKWIEDRKKHKQEEKP